MTAARRAALRRAPVRTGLRYAEQLLFYRGYRRRLERKVSRLLLGSDQPPLVGNTIDVPHAELNLPATRAVLDKQAADALIVSAAPILKPEIYSAASRAAINLHRGISPAYRGESTLFWALYNRDYANLGVTIHELDPGIDSGPIVAQARLPVTSRDGEAELLAAAARKSAELLVDYLHRLEQNPSEKPRLEFPTGYQTSARPDHLYLSRNRHLWHDARVYFRRLTGRQGTA